VPWKFEVAAGFAIATLLLVAQYRTSAVTGHGFSQLQSQFNTSQEELKNSKAQLEELRVGNSNLAKEVQDLQTAVEKLKKYIPPK
jgi:predicted  nucleic acid-binding Zn-ribbon protein